MVLYKRAPSTSLQRVLTNTTQFILQQSPYNRLLHGTNVLIAVCICMSMYVLFSWSLVLAVCIGEKTMGSIHS